MDHGRDGWRIEPCTVLQAWLIGFRLGKRESGPLKRWLLGNREWGFSALALSLSRIPASKHRNDQ